MTSAAALLLVLFSELTGQPLAREGPRGTEGVLRQEETYLNSAPLQQFSSSLRGGHPASSSSLSQSRAPGQVVLGHGGCKGALIPAQARGLGGPGLQPSILWGCTALAAVSLPSPAPGLSLQQQDMWLPAAESAV